MGVDLHQGAAVAHLGQLLGRQGLELLFRDGLERGDGLGLAGDAVRAHGLIGRRARLDEVQFLEQGDEGLGHPVLGLEVVAELDAVLGVLGGFAVDEERKLRVFGEVFVAAVDAHQHPLFAPLGDLAGGQDEGIAANVAGDVGVRLVAGFRRGEEVLALLQAHHRHRLEVFADEDHGIGQARGPELRNGERAHVGAGREAKARRGRIDPQFSVHLLREQLRLAIEHDVAGEGHLRDRNGFHGPCSRWMD